MSSEHQGDQIMFPVRAFSPIDIAILRGDIEQLIMKYYESRCNDKNFHSTRLAHLESVYTEIDRYIQKKRNTDSELTDSQVAAVVWSACEEMPTEVDDILAIIGIDPRDVLSELKHKWTQEDVEASEESRAIEEARRGQY